MAALDEVFIQATLVHTARPVDLRIGDLAAHYAAAGWHCTTVAGNVVTFSMRKKFRWILFIFLWLLGGISAAMNSFALVALPFFYLVYYFATANKNRTLVLVK